MRAVRTLTFLAFLLVAAALAGGIALDRAFEAPGPLQEEAIVHIPRGSGLSDTALRLETAGAVSSAGNFALGSWLRGGSRSLKAGEYRIEPGASMEQIYDQIRFGEVLHRKILIPEGSTAAEVAGVLSANPFLTGPDPEPPPQGSVAPDTYFFVRGEDRSAILSRMRRAQDRILEELWSERATGLPFDTPRKALILASIIEKETAVAEERNRVASVFVNRLRKGMRLQSDPTVIFGLTAGSGPLERRLTRNDLESNSPFNTYRIHGLPPAPICNPGRASIEAALQPEETEYLYFVADGSGGHAFARTLKEHNQNVARWRRIQREAPAE